MIKRLIERVISQSRAIQVLKAFMNIDKNFDERALMWLVVIHLVFVVSTLLLAWTDAIGDKAKGKESH